MGKSIGEMLQTAIRKDPVQFDGFGEPYWLHPMLLVDQMVLEGQLSELGVKLDPAVKDKEVQDLIIRKAMAIGTIQLSLRKGKEPTAERVFPDFEVAYRILNVVDMSPKVVEAFNLFSDTFELSDQEKKL